MEVEADIADDATVCCPNLASAASDNNTQATVKEEWTNNDDENGDSQCTNIDNLDGVDDASFQYYKRGTRGTSASAAQFLQQQQTAPTRTKAWNSIVQANNLRDLPMANTIFNTIKLDKAIEWAFSDSGATGHFLING